MISAPKAYFARAMLPNVQTAEVARPSVLNEPKASRNMRPYALSADRLLAPLASLLHYLRVFGFADVRRDPDVNEHQAYCKYLLYKTYTHSRPQLQSQPLCSGNPLCPALSQAFPLTTSLHIYLNCHTLATGSHRAVICAPLLTLFLQFSPHRIIMHAH